LNSQPIRRLLNDEPGQSLVLVALGAVAIVAVLAIVIDGGYTFAQRREIQNAADSAALAGARALSNGVPGLLSERQALDASVNNEVQSYGNRNSPRGGITTAATYIATDGHALAAVGSGETPVDSRGVVVTATTSYPSFFMNILGISSASVRANATAKHPLPVNGGTWAVWTGGTASCSSGALSYGTSSSMIIGSVHSNSNVQIGGGGSGNFIFGTVEAVSGVQFDPSKVTINSTINQPFTGTVDPNPYHFELSDFQPGGRAAVASGSQYYYIAGSLTKTTLDAHGVRYFDATTNTLRTGLYYVTGDVRFTGGISGTVVLVAEGKIDVSGSDNQVKLFQPASNPCALGGLVLYSNKLTNNICSSGEDAIDFGGSNNHFEGIVYAPRGRVSMSGATNGTSELFGVIDAQAVSISGSNLTLKAEVYCPNQGLYAGFIVR